MANAITHNTAVRTAFASTMATQQGSAGSLVAYTGTMPTNAATALSGNTAIATLTAVAFSPSAAVVTITATADTAAVGSASPATFFRFFTSGAACTFQGTIGTSGADWNLNSVTINASATVTLTSGSWTAPV